MQFARTEATMKCHEELFTDLYDFRVTKTAGNLKTVDKRRIADKKKIDQKLYNCIMYLLSKYIILQ